MSVFKLRAERKETNLLFFVAYKNAMVHHEVGPKNEKNKFAMGHREAGRETAGKAPLCPKMCMHILCKTDTTFLLVTRRHFL
jgi:hypothetical protein